MLFLEEFEENVEPAGEALDQNGFDLLSYAVDLYNDAEYEYRGRADSVASAYDEMVEKIGEDEYFRTGFLGDQLAACLREDGSVEDVLGGMMSVAVYLDEPVVEREWGKEPGFFTSIEYFPGTAYKSKEYGGHFYVQNMMVRHPYTKEDGLERLNKITEILEAEGFNVDMRDCFDFEGDPENWA
ncbi:hypothetical protein ACLI4R_14485 [Natrialbaceae archaeon A-chndr2]